MPQESELTIFQVASHYPNLTFIKKIGNGGQKQVFLAKDSKGTKVVVKFIQIDYIWIDSTTIMRNADAVTRAWREIDLIKTYSSPYLPSLYASEPKEVKVGDLAYITYTENHAGEDSIADIIERNGIIAETEVEKMLQDVANALKLYGDDNIVHRDVKPQNIIFDVANKRYVLIDGGVHLSPNNPTITKGYIPGTELYYSPEQANGERRGLDSRSDLFSLGITAYEALTGRHPFASGVKSLEEFKANRTNAIYIPLSTGLFTERTIRAVHKLLQRYPHNRYRNPATLLLEFNQRGKH